MITLAVLAVLLAVMGGVAVGVMLQYILDLRRRITDLEKASQKRLPYKSADEIENAIAAVLAINYELDVRKNMVDNALRHLHQARNPDEK